MAEVAQGSWVGKCLVRKKLLVHSLFLSPLTRGCLRPRFPVFSGKGPCGETPWISGRRAVLRLAPGMPSIPGLGDRRRGPPPPANPGWDFSCREGLPFLGSGGPADNASHRRPLLPWQLERRRKAGGAIVTPALPPAGTRPAPPSVESARREQPLLVIRLEARQAGGRARC